jgi:hypothetical protein
LLYEEMEANTPAAFADVFEVFERNGVRYVVVSGVAVVLHGHARPVYDLDIVVDSTPNEENRVMQALLMAGFVPSIPLPLSLVTVVRMFDQHEREIDVFARYHVSFDDLWADSVRISVGQSSARVASLEHLLHAKRTTGRPHDLEDVAGLLSLSDHK